MKWIFYVIVFIYLFFRAVYGAKVIPNSVIVERIDYGKSNFWKAGTHQSINCKASNKNLQVEWIDSSGNVVKRVPTNRIFSQEHFIQALRGGRSPALVLTFKNILPRDAGMYECNSGDLSNFVNVCVIGLTIELGTHLELTSFVVEVNNQGIYHNIGLGSHFTYPLEFVDTLAEVTADLGRSITLSCQAKGDPEPRIVWKRNGESIDDESDNSKYRVMTKYNSQGFEGLLTITSLEPEDSGVYYCVAIQENSRSIDCSHSETMNITLHVNHEPVFEDGNDTKQVYGKDNQSVDLVCSASGYPTPTYRWFRAVGSDTLNEVDEKQIVFNEEENQSVLTVTASLATFGQRYKCQVSNALGTAEKYFTLLKIDKPQEPSEVKFDKSTDNQIDLEITWSDPILFPIDGFEIQYLKTEHLKNPDSVPRDADWRKAKQVKVDMDDTNNDNPEINGILASITNLDEQTKYWIRLRVLNDAGESAWFMPVLASTLSKSEEVSETPTEEPVEEEESEETMKAELTSDGTFYGIFFAGGIIIVAVACMFAMRLV